MKTKIMKTINRNELKSNTEVIKVRNSKSRISKGFDSHNSNTTYYVDYLTGYIIRRFETIYDTNGQYKVDFEKSYFQNFGTFVKYDSTMKTKFDNAVKRIKRQAK